MSLLRALLLSREKRISNYLLLSRLKSSSTPPFTSVDDQPLPVSPENSTRVTLAAIHVELADKQRQSKNVIVAGLALIPGKTDIELFTALSVKKLLYATIHFCRRPTPARFT